MSATIPGKSKGDPRVQVEEAEPRELNYWGNRMRQELEENPDGQYAERNRQTLAAIDAELQRRAAGGQQQKTQDPAPRASSKTSAIQVVGESIASGQNLMAALQRLSESCTLIAPTTAIDQLPEGCAIAISMVKIDPENDAYCLTGNKDNPKPDDHMGLAKSAVESIGAAAGASWIPGLTGRSDDGKDPHYRHYVAWAEYMDLDGSVRRYNGECEIDLRDNSPQTLDIIRKAEKNRRDPNQQLAEARKFISRQCASKAMLVALRRPGLRHWYPRSVLESKPFAVTKLIFHGRTQDPALKQVFAKVIAERFLGATRQLFGAPKQPVRHAAPPVGTVPIDVHGETIDDDDFLT
jgi:hypothetical protein